MPDGVKTANSQVALNTSKTPRHSRTADPAATCRRELFWGAGRFGTYYIALRRTPSVTEQMLVKQDYRNPPGNNDRILDFFNRGQRPGCSSCVGGLSRRPPGSARRGCTAGDGFTRSGFRDPGSLGIGKTEEEHLSHEQPDRELATISDAAWADIVSRRARRTFEAKQRRGPAGSSLGPHGPDGPPAGRREHRPLTERAASDGVHRARTRHHGVSGLRVPVTVSRDGRDAVETRARTPNGSRVKDAAKKIAFAEGPACSSQGYQPRASPG